MPKRQKEKQYQSAREHRANQSIRSGTSASSAGARPLPFDCCALTLTPFTTPVCSSDGIIFDNAAITPYLMKHKVDPVTGRPMTSRDLLILNMDKDESTGKWQCPVLNKPFTDRTKIVAIRQRPPGNEANVFCCEAYHELNVKAKNYLDLVSGLKFTKDDVIILQDPNDERHCKLRDIQNFSHIHTQRDAAAAAAVINNNTTTGGDSGNVRHSVTASRIMDKLSREKRKREKAAEEASKKLLKTNDTDTAATSSSKKQQFVYTDELITSINLTSGKASGSFTSTSMDVASENSSRLATEDEIITSQCEQMKRLKKKGTIRMFTNFGAMDIEIHCDIVPRTAMNFMLLAEKGEYTGSKFHRSIPNFMIQGGKKAGSKGKDDQGSSYWDKPFKDEFDDRLTHSGQGVLSMANSGPGTNGRQFFITYKSCSHLDRKHSVFGKVIRGLDILRRMEQIPTNKESDKPLETVKIEGIEILDNPVSEALDLERRRIEKRKKEKQQLLDSRKSSPAVGLSSTVAPKVATPQRDNDSSKNSNADVASESFTIGKYLKVARKDSSKSKKHKQSEKSTDVDIGVSRLPPPPKKTSFGDFSGW